MTNDNPSGQNIKVEERPTRLGRDASVMAEGTVEWWAEWNATAAEYPDHATIHELFERQVKATPDVVAVRFGVDEVTYRDLNARANQLAHYLKSLGAGTDVLVGIAMGRSIEMIVGLLGILKSGGAYLPLDITYPVERLLFMLEDSGAPILLTEERLRDIFPLYRGRVVSIDAERESIGEMIKENPPERSSPDSLAYVIYTSGSTGRPKGSMLPHRGVVNYLCWATDAYRIREGSGSVLHSSISFDLTVTSLYTPLVAGSTIHLVPEEEGVEALARALVGGADRSLVKITPAHLELLSQQITSTELSGRTRMFVIGGENLLADTLRVWEESAPSTALVNEYGPTETVVGCCTYTVPAARHQFGAIPIGRPIANMRLYLLDEGMQPVRAGVPGEIFIGGDGLGRGYLNRPDLTAERFVPDPFAQRPGERLYRTGDLARLLADDNIEFIGRIDNQVKIRGYRIELGEIESLLKDHPDVRDVAVLLREDSPDDKKLVAYLVGRSSQPEDASSSLVPEVRSWLGRRLPDYMVPSAFVMLESIPLTPNGKIDRKALRPPITHISERHDGFVSPRDEVELKLDEMWQQVLGVDPISVNDNFFDLGGNSLLAARLFVGIRQAFDNNLSSNALLKAPTIAELALLLSNKQEEAQLWSSLVPIQPRGSRPPLYLVHGGHGTVLFYRKLADYLGLDQPLYGLQSIGLDGLTPPHTSVEEMAAHYIGELRRHQPQGPYLLGGFCFGGIVAFEMAQQFKGIGEEVALLCLLNTTRPEYINTPGAEYAKRLHKIPQAAPEAMQSDEKNIDAKSSELEKREARNGGSVVRRTKRLIRRRIERLPWQYQWKLMKLRYQMHRALGLSLPDGLQKKYVLDNVFSSWARKNYIPKVYPGRVELFKADGIYSDEQLGWGNLVSGELTVHSIGGDHVNHQSLIIEPIVQQLAERLRRSLEEAGRSSI